MRKFGWTKPAVFLPLATNARVENEIERVFLEAIRALPSDAECVP
jgi:hypothetical protein